MSMVKKPLGSDPFSASPVSESNLLNPASESGFSIFSAELSQLLWADYTWLDAEEFLIPPS